LLTILGLESGDKCLSKIYTYISLDSMKYEIAIFPFEITFIDGFKPFNISFWSPMGSKL